MLSDTLPKKNAKKRASETEITAAPTRKKIIVRLFGLTIASMILHDRTYSNGNRYNSLRVGLIKELIAVFAVFYIVFADNKRNVLIARIKLMIFLAFI